MLCSGVFQKSRAGIQDLVLKKKVRNIHLNNLNMNHCWHHHRFCLHQASPTTSHPVVSSFLCVGAISCHWFFESVIALPRGCLHTGPVFCMQLSAAGGVAVSTASRGEMCVRMRPSVRKDSWIHTSIMSQTYRVWVPTFCQSLDTNHGKIHSPSTRVLFPLSIVFFAA